MGSLLSKNSSTKKPKPGAYIEDNREHVQNGFGQPCTDPKARDDRLSFPLDNLDLSSISEQQLADLFSTAPKLHRYGGVIIVQLSKSLAIKGGLGVPPTEFRNMVFATESLHLPVPKVHRTFKADIPEIDEEMPVEGHFIVMGYVSGPTVKECWGSLDVSQRESVASQVAAIIDII